MSKMKGRAILDDLRERKLSHLGNTSSSPLSLSGEARFPRPYPSVDPSVGSVDNRVLDLCAGLELTFPRFAPNRSPLQVQRITLPTPWIKIISV